MDTTVKATAVSGHQRDILFDYYKVLLILLVVIVPLLIKMGYLVVPHARFYLYFRIFFQTDPILKKNALWTGHSLFCIRDSLLSFIHLYTGQRDRLLFYKTEIFPLVSDGTVRLETVVSSD